MNYKCIAIIFSLAFATVAKADFEASLWASVKLDNQVRLLENIRWFFYKTEPLYQKHYTSVTSVGSATNATPCLYAGHRSKMLGKRCLPPFLFDDSSYTHGDCGQNELQCNPSIFGEGICVPYRNGRDRRKVFDRCQKQAQENMVDARFIVETVEEIEFDENIQFIEDLCSLTHTPYLQDHICRVTREKIRTNLATGNFISMMEGGEFTKERERRGEFDTPTPPAQEEETEAEEEEIAEEELPPIADQHILYYPIDEEQLREEGARMLQEYIDQIYESSGN